MLDIILSVVGALFIAFGSLLAWSILLNKKINFKDWKFYFFIIIITILLKFNYNNVLKFTINVFFLSLVVKLLYNQTIKNSIVTTFYTQIVGIIFELAYSILAIYLFKIDFEVESLNSLIIFFADLFVSAGIVFMVKMNFFKKLYNAIINMINKIQGKTLLVILIPLIFIFNIYLEITFYKIGKLYVFVLNGVTIFIIMLIIYRLSKKENEYTKIYNKYNTTLNSLKEYEDILDKYRVSNHENKNELLTIRNMVVEKNQKAANYIDKLVKNKIKDDEKIMQEVSVIPAGGLRGLVYSKILYMKEKSIEYELNISKEIRTVDLINNISDSDMLDICHIVGVYIDNAIEAVIDLKDKYVNIDTYLENNCIVFEISNYYEGKIDLEKLEEKGYTTKSSGHGYGLSLTKEIISKNKKLRNEKRLSKETFTQVLKIKMK